jgi:hypothetical protein
MQTELTTIALQSTQGQQGVHATDALSIGQNLLTQLRTTRPVGRLVIDVRQAITEPGRSEDDIQLRPADTLAIPRVWRYVTVIDEVENPTSHIWKRGLNRDEYVSLSGRVTSRADKSRVCGVRADGSIAATESSRWFSASNTSTHTGDTVVVPLDAEKMAALVKWPAVTQIPYNIAIATAAVHVL